MKSREVFWDTPLGLEIAWYVLAAISVAVFLYGIARPVYRYRRASRESMPPISELPPRLLSATRLALSQATIAHHAKTVGWAHRGIFYGWLVLFAGTVIVLLDTDVTGPIFGFHFFQGDFYLISKSALNLLGTALIAGLLVMMVRRAVVRPVRLDPTRAGQPADAPQPERRRYRIADWTLVITLLVIALTGFLLEGVRIAMDTPGYGATQFGGWIVAQGLTGLGLGESTLAALRHGTWWFHGLLAITFVAAIPYTKASHMLTSFASLVLRDPGATRRLPELPDPIADSGQAPAIGYATLGDITQRHLIQVDACTRCGKCHEVCPARATGLPLSPRDVVLELHERAAAARPAGIDGVLGGLLDGAGAVPPGAGEVRLIGDDGVSVEAVWSCMQCNACVDICPVGIEQAPIINLMRRGLVEEGELDSALQGTLRSIAKSGNSFGTNKRKRGRWTDELEFEVPDARERPVDVLWFVGDYASFDPRSQQISRALARVLHGAGVDFGILYDGERNAGNDIRRVGEEGLFEQLSEHNTSVLESCQFNRILTTDPHSLNTLRNEYQRNGAKWAIVHHTTLLLELIEAGRLDVRNRLSYRVTFHDPCHMGRMNGEFDAPRAVLDALGCTILEMPRNRENSFCCGAGGGRIWMSGPNGAERPSENRIYEAIAIDPDNPVELFVVTCPKDVTMYEDAIKTTHKGDYLQLRELTELVAEALRGWGPRNDNQQGGEMKNAEAKQLTQWRIDDVDLEPMAVEPEWVLEGDPQWWMAETWANPERTTVSGCFRSTPGRFTYSVPADEITFVRSGHVIVTAADGSTGEFRAGDVMCIPAGTELTYDVRETLDDSFVWSSTERIAS